MSRRTLACLMLLLICSPVLAEQYAFLVGVKDYSRNGELTSLRYTEDDVHTLASTLSKSGVPQENIVLMTQRMAASNARLTPQSNLIRKEFDLLVSELGPGDSIIVGFSGHGLQFKNDPVNYFCPVDAKPDDKSTLISLTDVYQALDTSKARTKVLLVDACRNDPLTQLAKSAKRIAIEPIRDRAAPVLNGGTVAIFSCSASQQLFEAPDLKSGLFFHFVIGVAHNAEVLHAICRRSAACWRRRAAFTWGSRPRLYAVVASATERIAAQSNIGVG